MGLVARRWRAELHPKVYSVVVLGRGCSRSHRPRSFSGLRDALKLGLVVGALWKTGWLARGIVRVFLTILFLTILGGAIGRTIFREEEGAAAWCAD
jgi:hypothetical protein